MEIIQNDNKKIEETSCSNLEAHFGREKISYPFSLFIKLPLAEHFVFQAY